MSHAAEEWTDRFGRLHTSCSECEQPWPCRESNVKPAGWLVPLVRPSRPEYAAGDAAIDVVAHGFDVSVDDIMGRSQLRHVLIARHCAMAVVKTMSLLSFAEVGRIFGKDHTTVQNAVSRVMGDPDLRRGVELIVEELRPTPQLFAAPESTTNPPGYATSDPQPSERTIAI